jgi:hypothetical protein
VLTDPVVKTVFIRSRHKTESCFSSFTIRAWLLLCQKIDSCTVWLQNVRVSHLLKVHCGKGIIKVTPVLS